MRSSEVVFDSGGVACAATLYLPDRGPGPVPCVVMGAGGTLTRKDGIPNYAARFAAAGFAALAFDYRHWGDSDGQPRRQISIRHQLEDWQAAVGYALGLGDADPKRVVVWGMSLGGGHALITAAADPRIAAAIALVPVADGLALLKAYSPNVALRMAGRALRGTLTRCPMTVPIAGPPGSFAAIPAPESLPGFTQLAGANGWLNEASIPGTTILSLMRYRPFHHAATIRAPVLLQLGERDGMAPRSAIEKTAARAPHAELARYPIDHFQCFWPDDIERVAQDQVDFLSRHLLATSDAAASNRSAKPDDIP